MSDRTPPKFENAPGIVVKRRVKGWAAQWQARTDLVRRGWEPKSVVLWVGEWPTEIDRLYVSDRCTTLQNEMLVWGLGGLPVVSAFDGSLRSLINCYQTDEVSPYRKLRYKTRIYYDGVLRRLARDYGDQQIGGDDGIRARLILSWYDGWKGDGKINMAHGFVTILRLLFAFGETMLEDTECKRMSDVLSKMRFPMGKPRDARLTSYQATAIRKMAHEKERPSIALAQAFQFDLMLRQKDVIGEWVPLNEPGTSDVISGNEKWLCGLRYSEIDPNLILRHVTSKRNKLIEVDLKKAPMVMEELSLIGGELPTSGPVIVSETTDAPWEDGQFRRTWRKIARAAGVPDNVRNMDSRAGAITEATEAGAQLEDIRHAATHSDIGMTQRYARGATEKTAQVMDLRAKHRTKNAS